MSSKLELVAIFLFTSSVFSVTFPLTAISHYSELAPCAASHLTEELISGYYNGCSSAQLGLSSYGSCICAQRLSSIQMMISIQFAIDTECSSTSVQPFLSAFCDRWGVDIGADGGGASATTTAAGGIPTSAATPGGIANTGLPAPTSTSTSSGGIPTDSSDGDHDNKITIIASVVGSVAGVIAVVIAGLTYRHMRKGKQHHQPEYPVTSPGYGHPMQQPQSPPHGNAPYSQEYRQNPPRGYFAPQELSGQGRY